MTMPPFQPLPCDAGGAGEPAVDVEGTLVCDVNAAGDVVGTALVEAVYDDAGVRTGTRLVNVIDGTPYVPVGTVQPCREGCCPEPMVLCDVQADQSSVQFIRAYTGDEAGNIDFTDTTLTGAPYVPTGTVGECDPYTTCTPSPNIDVNAACGSAESVSTAVLLADEFAPLANSTFVDDATADGLCGGQWDRPASDLTAPFPVAETFRNLAFDQPGPVIQGTPTPFLTAGPPTNDGAGAGWLRLANADGGTNGLWQVPAPFSTAQGMNAAISFASHSGTIPGGDGQAFVFTDGSVAPQATPIGGFGNLGLQNWAGGYIAVVLDEYGQTCTCDQTPGGSPNPGPCGFCTNTISIQLAGASRIGASCACCTVASTSLSPKALNTTTRANPARLLVSIIAEGGQTFVSASIDWNDGLGPVQYFNRVNVTACAGPPPATLRMAAYAGSGGSFRAIKEVRDAVARPAGVSNWRAFQVTTDPIPACATLVNVGATVDVTPSDAGSQTGGNNDPELYFWLVDSATGTVLDRDQFSILPTGIGDTETLTVSASVPPASVPNLRLYVGDESRDDTGEYSVLWENLTVTADATGCPAEPVRTLAISAPCPIPVTIVGGAGDDGGGGGTTVFNAPSTFEDQEICATVAGVPQTAFRREVRSPDGAVDVSFLGANGLPITPDGGWTPGPCAADGITLGPVCYTVGVGASNGGFMTLDGAGNPVLYDHLGEVVPDGTYTIVICPLYTQQFAILCDEGNLDVDGNPHQFQRWYLDSPVLGQSNTQWDFELDGNTPYAVVGPVQLCGPAGDETVGRDVEQQILCDANGTRFIRVYQYGEDTGTPSGVPSDYTLAGAPFAPVGAVGICSTPVVTDFDFAQQVLCDANGTPFLRRFTFNSQTGAVTATVNLTLAGAAFAPVGAVGQCSDCCPQVIGEGCTNVGSGFYTAVRATNGTVSLVDSVTGAAVLPANIVPCPNDDVARTLTAQARLVGDADAPWTPGADVVGTLTSLTMTVLSGTATLTDQSGTVLAALPTGFSATWVVEDDNTLSGPQSIDAVGGSTVVHWTQR